MTRRMLPSARESRGAAPHRLPCTEYRAGARPRERRQRDHNIKINVSVFTAAVCVPALRVPLVHFLYTLINHFRQIIYAHMGVGACGPHAHGARADCADIAICKWQDTHCFLIIISHSAVAELDAEITCRDHLRSLAARRRRRRLGRLELSHASRGHEHLQG